MPGHSPVTLIWVPRRGIDGNCIVDVLAKAGLDLIKCGGDIRQYEKIWEQEPTCIRTKNTWPVMDVRRTRTGINLTKLHLINVC